MDNTLEIESIRRIKNFKTIIEDIKVGNRNRENEANNLNECLSSLNNFIKNELSLSADKQNQLIEFINKTLEETKIAVWKDKIELCTQCQEASIREAEF